MLQHFDMSIADVCTFEAHALFSEESTQYMHTPFQSHGSERQAPARSQTLAEHSGRRSSLQPVAPTVTSLSEGTVSLAMPGGWKVSRHHAEARDAHSAVERKAGA